MTPLSAAKGGPLVTRQSASPEDGGPRRVRCGQSATSGGIEGSCGAAHTRAAWRAYGAPWPAGGGAARPSRERAPAPGPPGSSADQPGCAPCLAPGDSGRRRSSESRVLWAPVMPLIHGGTLRASPRLPCLGFLSVKKESGGCFTF